MVSISGGWCLLFGNALWRGRTGIASFLGRRVYPFPRYPRRSVNSGEGSEQRPRNTFRGIRSLTFRWIMRGRMVFNSIRGHSITRPTRPFASYGTATRQCTTLPTQGTHSGRLSQLFSTQSQLNVANAIPCAAYVARVRPGATSRSVEALAGEIASEFSARAAA
jgi:hypothetical protein